MKKLLVIFGLACAISANVQAISKSDISAELSGAINTLNADALHPRTPVASQQRAVTAWDNAVAKAKAFVIDNSKDLLRKQDPDLMSFLSKIDSINNDFTNTIKVIRGAGQNAPISRLLPISNEAKKTLDQIRTKSFTLSGKKESQALLMHIADCIMMSAKYLYSDLLAK